MAPSRSISAKKATKQNNKKKGNKKSAQKPLSKIDVEIGQNYITQHAPGMGMAFSLKDPNM